MTTGRFFQAGPRLTLLTASNRAPRAGPVASSSQVQRKISGLNSGVRVTSATSAYTTSGRASMCRVTRSWSRVCIGSSRLVVAGEEHVEGSVGEAAEEAGVVVSAGFVGHLLGDDPVQHDRVQAQRLGTGGIWPQLAEAHRLGELRAHFLHLLDAD